MTSARSRPQTRHPGRRPYAGLDVEQRRAERRSRLQEAVLDELGDANSLTVTGLCRRSRVAARYFYEEYGTIEALVVALHDRLIDELVNLLVETADQSTGTVNERVRRMLETYVDWVAADRRRAQVFVTVIGLGPDAEAARRRALDRFAELLRRLSDAWLGPGAIPPTWRYGELFLVAGTQRCIEEWIADPDAPTPDDLVDQLEAVFTAMIRAIPAPSSRGSRR